MKRINEGTGLISSLGYRSGALGMRETQYASRLDRKDVRQTEADVGELENESVCVCARTRAPLSFASALSILPLLGFGMV